MEMIINPKTNYKNFIILLSQDKWFNKIADCEQLNKILNSTKSSDEIWNYSMTKMEFKDICLKRHVRPSKISKLVKEGLYSSRLIFTISCESCYSDDFYELKDPIKSLMAKMLVQFEYIENDSSKIIQSSWHLDRHDTTKTISTIHPLYHYEFGGTEITKDDEFDFGDFILLDTPRIMHPPLDIVLAIDFIINNFYNYNQHKNLTNKGIYKKYIHNAQLSIWRPYIISLASKFHKFEDYKIDQDFANNIISCNFN